MQSHNRNQVIEFVHIIIALILGLFLLGGGANLGISKSAVDLLGAVLSVPEYPAEFLRGVFLSWSEWVNNKDSVFVKLKLLQEENIKLKALNAELLKDKIDAGLDAALREARVTLRAPSSWWNEIRIDRGGRDDITEGLPVFNNGFLIGRISSVSLMSSWAELLTSPSLMLPVVIEETRELGIIEGDGAGRILLQYIPVGRGIKPGMSVSTALIGEDVPSGLPIGKIAEELAPTPDGYAVYRVEPGADLSKFYTVSFLNLNKIK